jgi:hypothetical protein
MSLLRRLYAGWLVIAGRFGSIQTLVLLGLFYATLIGPAWLGVSVARRDLLDKRRHPAGDTAWKAADSTLPDLERAKLTS